MKIYVLFNVFSKCASCDLSPAKRQLSTVAAYKTGRMSPSSIRFKTHGAHNIKSVIVLY